MILYAFCTITAPIAGVIVGGRTCDYLVLLYVKLNFLIYLFNLGWILR